MVLSGFDNQKQILVTCYVGSPKGLQHCDDAGHQMKKVVHEDGHEFHTAESITMAEVRNDRGRLGIRGPTWAANGATELLDRDAFRR